MNNVCKVLFLNASYPNSMYSWLILAKTAAYECRFSSTPTFAMMLPSTFENNLNKIYIFYVYIILVIPGPRANDNFSLITLGISILNGFP